MKCQLIFYENKTKVSSAAVVIGALTVKGKHLVLPPLFAKRGGEGRAGGGAFPISCLLSHTSSSYFFIKEKHSHSRLKNVLILTFSVPNFRRHFSLLFFS